MSRIRKLFIDVGEIGWSQMLAAHMKYLVRELKEEVAVCCPSFKNIFYRDITNEIFPLTPEFIKEYGGYLPEGNHLYDPVNKVRIMDHNKMFKSFKDKYPKYEVILNYNKFITESIYEPYIASDAVKEYIMLMTKRRNVILIFPRYRESKFQCRNLDLDVWISITNELIKANPDSIIVSIGSEKGSYNLSKYIDSCNLVDLTLYNNEYGLSLLVGFCNLNLCICSIGSQSALVKISLLCGCPSFIIGDEERRHSVDENWMNTDVEFFKCKRSSKGYIIERRDLLIQRILSFVERLK